MNSVIVKKVKLAILGVIRAGDRVGQLGIFPGPTAPGGPMGAHSKGKIFVLFQRKEKIENFWTRKMILRLT